MNAPLDGLDALTSIIDQFSDVAVAVSGGVDSLTLATAVHRRPEVRATMFHAVSPAVPEEATERVREQANDQGWHLRVIDAGEFADTEYRTNPVNHC